MYEKECIKYIQRLNVPDGYTIEQLSILEAKSMTAGYNEGMKVSDAKYKVYLHQDVFIVNQDFIIEMLKIFENPNIGMMGMVGSPKMPKDGIMWSDERVGGVYACSIKESGEAWAGYVPEPYETVEAIDGLLMATQYDLEWREDLFAGWDFYDVSQSMEFRRRGYEVVVPHQKKLWCIHDDGYINLEKYFGWREVFLKEYGDMLHE